MRGKRSHKTEKTDGKEQLPLHSFFISLKQNGFSLTHEQITDCHTVIDQYASTIKNESELCDYLSPLFAQDEEEQKQFKELFDLHFKEKEQLPQPGKRERIVKHLKKHGWKYLITILFIVAGVLIIRYINKPPVLDPRPQIVLFNNDENVMTAYGRSFITTPGKKIEIYPHADYKNNSSQAQKNDVELHTRYDWGDHSTIDTISSHIYTSEGAYYLKGFVDVFYKKHFQYTDTATGSVTVCGRHAESGIKGSIWSDKTKKYEDINFDSVPINTQINFESNFNGDKPDSVFWFTPEETGSYGNSFETPFKLKGSSTVTVVAIYDSINSPCTKQKAFNLFVYDPSKPNVKTSISPLPTAKAIGVKKRVKTFWFYLLSISALLSFLIYRWCKFLYTRTKKRTAELASLVKEKVKAILASFSGKKPPYELPFLNKNYLAVPEQEINEFSRQLRRRISDESRFLDLDKTIQKSIKSAGMYQPVIAYRTMQSEYLALIDETQRNNQQVKLFEYLSDTLKKHNVNIEKYYYHDSLDVCFNINEPNGISLEKLSEKYAGHVLLIFGNAYQLLLPHYPLFNYEYRSILNRWRYKAILTPISFDEWDNKETRALSSFIPVLPVDSEGLLLLMHAIFSEEKEDMLPLLSAQRKRFYKTGNIDFESVSELKAYCDQAKWASVIINEKSVNILFQWIAALSVYPRIRWEVTLAIGKAILNKYDKPRELNYANLLHIVRIKWMQEGQFPDYTRLDLLKELDPENEVIARETILTLLNEIPDEDVNNTHFVHEEMVMQRIINEYNLYSYDSEKYAAYATSKLLFEELWKQKKIRDSPARVYMKNEEKAWDTLVSDNSQLTTKTAEEGSTPKSKYYKRLAGIFSIACLISIAGLIGLFFMNLFGKPEIANIMHTITEKKKVLYTYINRTNDKTLDKVRLKVGNTTTNLQSNITDTITIIPSDSAELVVLRLGKDIFFDSSMVIDRDAYIIHLDDRNKLLANRVSVKLMLTNRCLGSVQQFRDIITKTDTSFLVIDSLINNPSLRRDSCMNSISFGIDVSQNAVNNIINSFRRSDIRLQVNPISPYPIGNNEMIIYYQAAQSLNKPLIFIRYNDPSSLQKVQQFQQCLNMGVFNARGIENQTGFSRNEIRYYNNSFLDSLSILQNCLRSFYPGKIFTPVKINGQSGVRAEVWIFDSIHIDAPVVPTNVESPAANGFAYFQEGVKKFNERRFDSALLYLNLSISSGYSEAEVYRYKGDVHSEFRQLDSACKYYKKASDAGDALATASYNRNCGTVAPINNDSTRNYKKLAVLIGIDNYKYIRPVSNYVNSVNELEKNFRSNGYETMVFTNEKAKAANLLVTGMKDIRDKQNVEKYDVILFYLAGHFDATDEDNLFFLAYDCNPLGDKNNYLVTGTIQLYNLFVRISRFQPKIGILLFDGPNDTELPGGAEGKQFINSFVNDKRGSNMLMGSGIGNYNINGQGSNGPISLYAEALINSLNTPNLNLIQAFDNVNRYVKQKTGGKVNPFYQATISSNFCFSCK